MAVDSAALSATMEDYLRVILRLSRSQRVVRLRDIVNLLGVAPSTATGAVQTLKKRGLLSHQKYEDVVLTDRGHEIAEAIEDRHQDIRHFLETVLLLDPEMADEEACRLEHSISAFTLERLRRFAVSLHHCPHEEPGCLGTYRRYVETDELAPSRCSDADDVGGSCAEGAAE